MTSEKQKEISARHEEILQTGNPKSKGVSRHEYIFYFRPSFLVTKIAWHMTIESFQLLRLLTTRKFRLMTSTEL